MTEPVSDLPRPHSGVSLSAMKILVVGASGFLGANVAVSAGDENEVVAHSSRTADLVSIGSGEALVESVGADMVINCAALADVDRCYREDGLAWRLNAELPGELAAACSRHGARFIHISTDAVFGSAPGPYMVTSPTGPANHYGVTKLAGEYAVADAGPDALIVRTNIVGWSPTGGRSLLEFFMNRLVAGEPVNGFTDVWFRPVGASDIFDIVKGLGDTAGVVHATGADLISKFDFGVAVAERFGYDPSLVRPGSLADGELSAMRVSCLDVVPSIDPSPPLDVTLGRLKVLSLDGYRKDLASCTS